MDSLEERQRDIFPLPLPADAYEELQGRVSRGTAQRVQRRLQRREWMCDGIRSLNLMAGCSSRVGAPRNAAQRLALSHVEQAFEHIGPPAEPAANSKEALQALLGTSAVYHSARADVLPYNRDLVSWPSVGSQPVELASALSEADSVWFREWKSHLLRDPDSVSQLRSELNLKEPYCDSSLTRNLPEYSRF